MYRLVEQQCRSLSYTLALFAIVILIGCAANTPLPTIEIPELVSGFGDISPEQPTSRVSRWWPRVATGYDVRVVFRASPETDLTALETTISHTLEALPELEAAHEKIDAFHTLGTQYLNKAHLLYSDVPGHNWEPYIAANRAAAEAFSQAIKLAGPITALDSATREAVTDALFNAGQIHYFLGLGIGLPEDYRAAIAMLSQLVEFSEQNGITVQRERVKTALNCIGSAYFELGRMQSAQDETATDGLFQASAEAYEKLALRFPEDADRVQWQYQVAEAYYAGGSYTDAISVYRRIWKEAPAHPLAPAALDKAAFCHVLLADMAGEEGRPDEKRMGEAFEILEMLVTQYPDSPYAAESLMHIGDQFYTEASARNVSLLERIRRYKTAIEKYEQAMRVPNAPSEIVAEIETALRQTESLLASQLYAQASQNLDTAKLSQGKTQQALIQGIVTEFQQIVVSYMNTKYADLAYAQIGRAYMFLGMREAKHYTDALNAFNTLIRRHAASPPNDAALNDALTYARIQAAWIQTH